MLRTPAMTPLPQAGASTPAVHGAGGGAEAFGATPGAHVLAARTEGGNGGWLCPCMELGRAGVSGVTPGTHILQPGWKWWMAGGAGMPVAHACLPVLLPRLKFFSQSTVDGCV
eukprot:1157935-Pelagomonas_calceolata.AAC.4